MRNLVGLRDALLAFTPEEYRSFTRQARGFYSAKLSPSHYFHFNDGYKIRAYHLPDTELEWLVLRADVTRARATRKRAQVRSDKARRREHRREYMRNYMRDYMRDRRKKQ